MGNTAAFNSKGVGPSNGSIWKLKSKPGMVNESEAQRSRSSHRTESALASGLTLDPWSDWEWAGPESWLHGHCTGSPCKRPGRAGRRGRPAARAPDPSHSRDW